jgi:hypothetical protein
MILASENVDDKRPRGSPIIASIRRFLKKGIKEPFA